MSYQSKFWPLDFDPENEIYENLSWDLPGRRPLSKGTALHKDSPPMRNPPLFEGL
jgi:hypothetical protein